MGAAESRSHLEESTSVPVLTINGEIDDETGREAGFASEVTAEQAARRRGLGPRACSRGLGGEGQAAAAAAAGGGGRAGLGHTC